MAFFGSGRDEAPGIKRRDSGSGGRLFIMLVIVSLVMFTMSVREDGSGALTTVRGAFMTVTTPMRIVGSVASLPFQGLGNVFSNLTANQESLSDLRAENERLASRNAELEEEAQAATRLQQLLELKNAYNLQSQAARIISASTDSWTRTVVIDRGTSSGLAVGMPVTDAGGAIGQIIECDAASSTVRLVTDENSDVSAMVQSSRAQGMLKGSTDGTLHLTLISTDQTVNVGDTIVTSGLGGVFPKGLPLGKVASVNRSDGALYYDIEVTPASSTENFEEVLVITSLTEEQEASSQDIAEADSQDAAVVGGDSSGSDSPASPGASGTDAASGPKRTSGQ